MKGLGGTPVVFIVLRAPKVFWVGDRGEIVGDHLLAGLREGITGADCPQVQRQQGEKFQFLSKHVL